jgi:hypothetical protein
MKSIFILSVLSTVIILITSACSQTNVPAAPDYTNNPKIPGGSVNTDPATLSVSNFIAFPKTTGDVELSWVNPAPYSTLIFDVVLFRKQCATGETFCTAPSPKSAGAQALYKIYSGTGNVFTDTTAQAGRNYTYWIFVSYSNSFSAPQTSTTVAIAGQSSLASITKTNFWPNSTWTIGLPRTPGTTVNPSVYLLGMKKNSELEISGKSVLGESGTLLYYADTENNRIVIMVKQIGYQCIQAKYTDPVQLKACLSQSFGEPFVPMNILGQPDRQTNLSCTQHAVRCGNTANDVKSVTGSNNQTKYQVLDSLDHSTVVGTFGTLREARQSSCESSKFCTFDGNEAGNVCAAKRDKCMTAPTHVYVDNDKLLVSDSGNDRILVYNTLPTQYAACDQNIGADIVVKDNCSANSVIGKKTVTDLTDYSVASYGSSNLVSVNLPVGISTLRLSTQGAFPYNLSGISLESIAPGSTYTANGSPTTIPETGKTVFDISLPSKFLGTIFDNMSSPGHWGKVTPGSYLEYQIDVAKAATYQLKLNYSSTINNTLVDILINGERLSVVNLTPKGGGIFSDGDKILSKPGALVVKDGSLYIADRGNNRVVRARGYDDANLFGCSTDVTQIMGGESYGDWNSLCKFDHVLGQQTLFENLSFNQIVLDKQSQGINVISSDGAGNSLTPNYQNLLKRYFGTPTAISFTNDGQFLIAGDENFILDAADLNTLSQNNTRYRDWYVARIDKSPIALKSRILSFDENLLSPTQPSCQPSVFGVGGCDASYVYGQLDFKTIPIFSGDSAADYRNSISYGLSYVTDFIVDGKTMMAVDGISNDIYFWSDLSQDIQGRPYNFRIENPAGSAFPNNPNRAMPNLKSISGILYDPITQSFVISDPGSGQLFQVNKPR